MSLIKKKSPALGARDPKGPAAKASLGSRLWRLMVEHPKGVLIAAATFLGLIVVLQNWNYVPARLLVTNVKLPFIVWALIFMLVGYLTGKWIEWGIRARQIRKGTYAPKLTSQELADASASLDGRLERGDEPPLGVDADPATIIDRSGGKGGGHDRAVESVDYWEDGAQASGPELGQAPVDYTRPVAQGDRGDYSPAVSHAAGEAPPAGRRDRSDPLLDAGRYDDYGDAGRYDDYGDAGRYDDYGDAGRYSDQQDRGRRRPGGGRRR